MSGKKKLVGAQRCHGCLLNTRDYMRESLLLLIFILHVLIIRRQNKWMPWRSSEWRKGVYWSHRSYEYHYSKSPPGLLNQSRGGGPNGDQREPVKVSSHSFYPAPQAMLVMWDLDQILTQRRSGPDLDQVQHTGWYLPVAPPPPPIRMAGEWMVGIERRW